MIAAPKLVISEQANHPGQCCGHSEPFTCLEQSSGSIVNDTNADRLHYDLTHCARCCVNATPQGAERTFHPDAAIG